MLLVAPLWGCDGGDEPGDGGMDATDDVADASERADAAPQFGAACLTADPGSSVECAQCMCDVCPDEVSACDADCWAAVECARPCTLLDTFGDEVACIMEMCPADLAAFLTDPIASFDQCMIANAADGDLRACQSECADD